jgi:serine/threonine protein kinase
VAMTDSTTQSVSSLFPRRTVLPLQPDDPVAVGPYSLVCRLPSGGMGADVFIADRPTGDGHVVVKALRSQAPDGVVARFSEEARNAASVSSPRVAAVIDRELAGVRPYYVQEYVDGTPLSELLDRRGTGLLAEELRRLAIGLLLAIVDVHSARVAHRDIKPGNIIITPGGEVVLVDFGISRETDASGSFDQTESVLVMLTPYFAAPEQMRRSRGLSRAVDVYAWGMVVAYASLGHHPVEGAQDMGPGDYFLALEREDFNLQRLPPGMIEVVREALAPRPKARPQPQVLLRRVDDATRWVPPTKGMTLVQPRWAVGEVRSMAAALNYFRYWLSTIERAVVDNPLTYRALLVLAVPIGALFGAALALLYFVLV